jgi:hypothetical protein
MSTLTLFENAHTAFSTTNLPVAAWDLVSFLDNAKEYVTVIGGALITLLGLAVVIWATVLIAKKFFGTAQNQQESWIKVVVMILVGGALMTGGIALVTTIAAGGKTTLEELGGGYIVLQSVLNLVR